MRHNPEARFVTYEHVRERFEGKTVAIVCSGPGCLDNEPGFIDSHDVVVRVQQYDLKAHPPLGERTDVYYSFFGNSIKKPTVDELKAQGVTLCMAKCPDANCGSPGDFMDSEWHRKNGKLEGVDYRYVYTRRASWWFCDTYVPTKLKFKSYFDLLNHHQPTTGFACILDVLGCNPASVYLTGFDGFTSRIHNVDEHWPGIEKNPDDPFRHMPGVELQYLKRMHEAGRISVDRKLAGLFTVAAK